jgi:hypothetical protein
MEADGASADSRMKNCCADFLLKNWDASLLTWTIGWHLVRCMQRCLKIHSCINDVIEHKFPTAVLDSYDATKWVLPVMMALTMNLARLTPDT